MILLEFSPARMTNFPSLEPIFANPWNINQLNIQERVSTENYTEDKAGYQAVRNRFPADQASDGGRPLPGSNQGARSRDCQVCNQAA